MEQIRRKKKREDPRYEIRSSVRTFHTYTDRAWAEHSAECYASFFNTPVEVFDTEEGTVLCTKYPASTKEAQA